MGRAAGTGGQLGQNSRDMTDWSGMDILDRTSGTGQLGQGSRDRSDRKGGLIGNLDRTVRA